MRCKVRFVQVIKLNTNVYNFFRNKSNKTKVHIQTLINSSQSQYKNEFYLRIYLLKQTRINV